MRKTLAFFFVVMFFSSIAAVGIVGGIAISYPKMFRGFVSKYSSKYGIDESMVFAIIRAESGFDVTAVSRSGAMGLMQIMPETGAYISRSLGRVEFASSDLFDAETNIEFGCFYLDYLSNKFDSHDKILCAYNLGETRAMSILAENPNFDFSKIEIGETRRYIRDVKRNKKVYDAILR